VPYWDLAGGPEIGGAGDGAGTGPGAIDGGRICGCAPDGG
jgi:hypothetical protein